MAATTEVVLTQSVTLPKLARALTRDTPTLLALAWLIVVFVSAAGAPIVAPYDRLEQDLAMRNEPPLTVPEDGGFPHILGTDPLGRDMLSRLIYGARVSLAVGVSSVLASGTLGVFLGLIAGYYRGFADVVIMRVVDAMIAFPTLLFALFILFVIGPGFVNLVAVMAFFRWMTYARVTRSMTLKYREEPFVEGAETIGASDARIIFRHIVPNLLSPILVLATLEFAVMILSEASLSFLGFGIQLPRSSWGVEAALGRDYLRSAWWLVTFPGLVILLTTLSLNLVATWLRAVGDPENRWRWLLEPAERSEGREASQDRSDEAARLRPVSHDPRLAGPITDDEHLLEVSDLRVEFRTLTGILKAVNGISYTLDEGETLAIVGESGSGKTVSAETVMGILDSPPGFVTAGSVLFRGADLLKMHKAERREIRGEKMAMVFQDALTALNPGLSVGYQIAEMYRIRRGMSSAEAREKAIECLERVHIPSAAERVDDFPHQFSGGMRQRVMIAMALALDPDILIADEPTTALDVTVQAQIMELLADLQAGFDMGLILITHDLAVVAEVADRMLVMYAGKVMETGPCVDVFARLAHPYSEALMSSIPRSDKKRTRLDPIDGAPPDLKRIPSGCAFSPRCVYAGEYCEAEEPGLMEVAPNHFIACHQIRRLR